jgi:hypothetical protein
MRRRLVVVVVAEERLALAIAVAHIIVDGHAAVAAAPIGHTGKNGRKGKAEGEGRPEPETRSTDI